MDSCAEQTYRAIESTTRGITAAELAWHSEGKWNAAQVLEHLSLTYTGTTKMARRLAAGEHPPKLPRTWRNRLFTFVTVTIGYLPSGRKSPEMVVPGQGTDPETLLKNLAAMDEALSECERRHGPNVAAEHPILGPLTIPQWRKFHCVHANHHMKQVTALREQCDAQSKSAAV